MLSYYLVNPAIKISLIAPKNCMFWGASFELIQNLATLDPENLQGSMEHPYTIVTP